MLFQNPCPRNESLKKTHNVTGKFSVKGRSRLKRLKHLEKYLNHFILISKADNNYVPFQETDKNNNFKIDIKGI